LEEWTNVFPILFQVLNALIYLQTQKDNIGHKYLELSFSFWIFLLKLLRLFCCINYNLYS